MDFWGVIDRISRNRITFRPFRPDYALMRPISAQFNSATRQVTPDRPETYCAMRAGGRQEVSFGDGSCPSLVLGQTRVLGIVRWSIRTKRKMSRIGGTSAPSLQLANLTGSLAALKAPLGRNGCHWPWRDADKKS